MERGDPSVHDRRVLRTRQESHLRRSDRYTRADRATQSELHAVRVADGLDPQRARGHDALGACNSYAQAVVRFVLVARVDPMKEAGAGLIVAALLAIAVCKSMDSKGDDKAPTGIGAGRSKTKDN